MNRLLLASVLMASATHVVAQDDDFALLDSLEAVDEKPVEVTATFKETKIISLQTTQTVKAKTMAFNIAHLFGNIGANSGGGVHTLYGLDVVSDVRFAFDYGITDELTVGVARSKQNELIDATLKWRFMSQTIDNKKPLSIAFYGNASINPTDTSQFYSGIPTGVTLEHQLAHRLSYTSQLVLARKFSKRFSMVLAPTFQYRNYILEEVNPDNGAKETNGLFAIGAGFRYKFTQRVLFVADYFYTFSEYRRNNTANPFYNPLSVGVEIETGGHVFHINFTNASGIIENNFLPRTKDNWLDGGYKFGFNISRVFNIGK